MGLGVYDHGFRGLGFRAWALRVYIGSLRARHLPSFRLKANFPALSRSLDLAASMYIRCCSADVKPKGSK